MNTHNKIRITALNGSPKKNGNTVTLMKWVLEGCQEAGAEVELIHIKDYSIQYCQGCHTCLRTGKCVIDDDMRSIYERLNNSEGIVVGSPVYSGEPTALLKTFLDRLTLFKLYSNIYNTQKTIGVTTSGIAPTKRLAKRLSNFFGRRIGVIGVKTASLKKGYLPLLESYPKKTPKKARALGKKLVKSIEQNTNPRVFSYWWILLLRKYLLSRILKINPEQFAGIIPIWLENGWLKF
ncbi:MAG: flavodoxin family protein [Candidatus Thorarchaeota archaeon]